jgi:hypothetical protein
MSFYIGDAAVHTTPFAVIKQEEAALEAEVAGLRRAFGQLAREILILLINAILRALGLSAFAGPLDAAITALENALLAIPHINITSILGGANLGADLQAIVDALANVLGFPGEGNSLAQLESYFAANGIGVIAPEWAAAEALAGVSNPTELVLALRRLFSAALSNLDGTVEATLAKGFAQLENGLTSFVSQVGINEVTHLIQQLDGTIVTIESAVQNAVRAATAAAAPSLGHAVTAGQQMIDHSLAALTGGTLTLGNHAQDYGAAAAAANANLYNAMSGASAVVASEAQVAAAAAAATAAANALTQQTSQIAGMVPHFYGGSGASGNVYSVPLTQSDSLTGFTNISSDVGSDGSLQVYNLGTAATDQQEVSALWNVILKAGETRGVTLRSSADGTTYCWATITQNGSYGYSSIYEGYYAYVTDPHATCSIQIGCVVAGVITTFQTNSYPTWKYVGTINGHPVWTPITGHRLLLASANHSFAFEAVGDVFTLSFDTASWTYTDGSSVSQIGSSYRSGGFMDNASNNAATNIAWDFYDAGPTSGPATATVLTAETTTSSTPVDLATTTDQVTITVGSSGLVIVFLNSEIISNTASAVSTVLFALSGANTMAAAAPYQFSYQAFAASAVGVSGAPFLMAGLNPGATTFKMKYKTSSGTATFSYRMISAIPL